MARVAVARQVRNDYGPVPPLNPNGPVPHPKMEIVVEGGTAFTVPYAPRETTLENIAPRFDVIDRGGREPLLLRSADSLPTMNMELVLAYPDPHRSVEPSLTALRQLAKSGKRLRVKLDSTSGGHRWRLTGFTQQVLARQPGTNAPTRALCTLTFTAASDAVVEVGPVSGGHNGGGKGGKDDDKNRPKFYVVKKGDTLQSIAERFYGKASYWRGIADVNNIRDPRKLKVGLKLTLPKKNAADFGPAPGAEFGDEE